MPEMKSADLRTLQQSFTAHVRNPGEVNAPEGIEGRRMKIYNDLIYNNIEGFLSGGFPVIRSLYRDEDWHRLVRDFIVSYRCSSPYFLEISQEFINYLMHTRERSPVDPPFLLELAHYEWVELMLDVSTETFPGDVSADGDPLASVPVVSPLVVSLQYRYPVHRIGPGNEPDHPPAQPTYLIVYRNRQEKVRFMEANAATARLLELLSANEALLSGREVLERLAKEMNAESVTPVVEFGARMLAEFLELDILAGCRQ
jgi:hypothetical protein